LVQILDAVQLATKGELRPTPNVEIVFDSARLRVRGAQMVWPRKRDFAIKMDGERGRILLDRPDHYTALYLKLG
jgi:hypothetical protein